jgi:preprotein translocase subunit SecB
MSGQGTDSSISFQATSGAIKMDLRATTPPLSIQTFSIRIQASPTAAVGSRHLVECDVSAYGVSSLKVKNSIRIGR